MYLIESLSNTTSAALLSFQQSLQEKSKEVTTTQGLFEIEQQEGRYQSESASTLDSYNSYYNKWKTNHFDPELEKMQVKEQEAQHVFQQEEENRQSILNHPVIKDAQKDVESKQKELLAKEKLLEEKRLAKSTLERKKKRSKRSSKNVMNLKMMEATLENLQMEVRNIESQQMEYNDLKIEKEEDIETLNISEMREELETECKNVVEAEKDYHNAKERRKEVEERQISVQDDHSRYEGNLLKEQITQKSLLQQVNLTQNQISVIKESNREKEEEIRILDDSDNPEEDIRSFKTNDSSKSASSQRQYSRTARHKGAEFSEEKLFEDGDITSFNDHWQKEDAIPEESEGNSSLDEITPRRLEEDQEEIARFEEELMSGRQITDEDLDTVEELPSMIEEVEQFATLKKEPKLHLSHISSVNNSRDDTNFMSPQGDMNQDEGPKVPMLNLGKLLEKDNGLGAIGGLKKTKGFSSKFNARRARA